jgi:hypothetical protein
MDKTPEEAEEETGGFIRTKKDGTNGLAVRAGRPVTQLTSSSGAASSTASITGIYTP